MQNISGGALAGMAATVPMTLTMAALHRMPKEKALKLPMEQVGHGTLKQLKVFRNLDETERDTFTWVSHFLFGAGAGAVFPYLLRENDEHAVAKGVAFGMGVWATSYFGVLPALGITKFPTEQPKRHVALEAVAHVVWGAALGYFAQRIHTQSKRSN